MSLKRFHEAVKSAFKGTERGVVDLEKRLKELDDLIHETSIGKKNSKPVKKTAAKKTPTKKKKVVKKSPARKNGKIKSAKKSVVKKKALKKKPSKPKTTTLRVFQF